MMTEPPKPKEGDEICPICKRPKSKHTSEEMLACSKKMMEFKNDDTGGAGIEWNYEYPKNLFKLQLLDERIFKITTIGIKYHFSLLYNARKSNRKIIGKRKEGKKDHVMSWENHGLIPRWYFSLRFFWLHSKQIPKPILPSNVISALLLRQLWQSPLIVFSSIE